MHPSLKRTDLAVGNLDFNMNHGPTAHESQGVGEGWDCLLAGS